MAASMMIPVGYSSVMAAESADIVTDITDSKLAGMFAGTIVAIGSYGGLKSLDQSVNISGLYPLKEAPCSYAELMAPEEAERYLKFLENGSMKGLTDAEIAAIRKVDEALALQKVDGQSVLEPRRPVTTGESGSITINPNEIRYSQSSVNGSNDIIQSMRENGWKGDPIDVVEMPDGIYTTIDNTHVVSAREAGINVQANVHSYNDPLPSEYIERFTTKRGTPKTWGEAIELRIAKQKASFKNGGKNKWKSLIFKEYMRVIIIQKSF